MQLSKPTHCPKCNLPAKKVMLTEEGFWKIKCAECGDIYI